MPASPPSRTTRCSPPCPMALHRATTPPTTPSSTCFARTSKLASPSFERYLDKESIQMFESLGVMTKKELEARNEVKWETYTKKIQIEARVLGDLSMNHIIPVATSYQSQLLRNVERMSSVFSKDKANQLNARNLKLIEEIAERTATIETLVEELVEARKVANKIADEHQKAIAYHDAIAPMFDKIRYQIDKLELIVDDSLWPLPKYRELLFIR